LGNSKREWALVLLGVVLFFLGFAPGLAAAATGDAGEVFDAGKATGAAIQAYRDAYVPQVFSPPARGWLYADVTVLALLVLSGSWFVLSNRPARWITAHLAAALLYFGLFRGGCLCPVGATANAALGVVRPELIGRAELAIFLVPLVIALFCGRIFCGTVCPLGAIQHLVSPRRAWPLPRWLHRVLLALPVVVLFATVGYAFSGKCFLVCRLDPYVPVFFQSHAWVQKITSWITPQFAEPGLIAVANRDVWLMLAVVLLLGWLIPRVFCRYVCPYGVLLGLLSVVAFRRRHIEPGDCVQCRKCEGECPVQAISVAPGTESIQLSVYQCVQCGRCSSGCQRGAARA
jgi:polyferredoxin